MMRSARPGPCIAAASSGPFGWPDTQASRGRSRWPTSGNYPGSVRRSEQPVPATEPAAPPPIGVLSYDTDRVWTLPNVLSLLRIAGVALMLYLILGPHADGLAVLVLAAASFTDWLDGFLARRWHQTSRLGRCSTRSPTGSTSSRC